MLEFVSNIWQSQPEMVQEGSLSDKEKAALICMGSGKGGKKNKTQQNLLRDWSCVKRMFCKGTGKEGYSFRFKVCIILQ